MKYYKTIISLLLLFNCSFLLHAQQTKLTANVLVIGGGTGGTEAGIQSGRLGVKTIINLYVGRNAYSGWCMQQVLLLVTIRLITTTDNIPEKSRLFSFQKSLHSIFQWAH
jgi:NADPH-dependent glutamate synthase beta subunit-like oxidoreductase